MGKCQKKATNLVGENINLYKTVSKFFYEPTRGKAILNFVLVSNRVKGKTDYVKKQNKPKTEQKFTGTS